MRGIALTANRRLQAKFVVVESIPGQWSTLIAMRDVRMRRGTGSSWLAPTPSMTFPDCALPNYDSVYVHSR
jgi:hypothetical protein